MDKRKMPVTQQNLARGRGEIGAGRAGMMVDRRIRAFINGESHGEDVLRALYGDIAHEPLPERLRGLLRD
jgi:hypothetical protein